MRARQRPARAAPPCSEPFEVDAAGEIGVELAGGVVGDAGQIDEAVDPFEGARVDAPDVGATKRSCSGGRRERPSSDASPK